ncbi:serine/threonine-protein phosphatase 2A activator-like [Gordionus sp. m RMFG-2023]|uniref:serine/threonine-protein phosphatase 2A activator-like n=1 Tax=Gordionus sp. m RMFG-2023 TaxID=3053472 RepID=UPI0031FDE2AD
MKKWINSSAYKEYVQFIEALNDGVKSKSSTDLHYTSNEAKKIVDILEIIERFIDNIPPIDQPQRFGNKAFKTFYQKLCQESKDILKSSLNGDQHAAIIEIAPYLNESFGNEIRIDYGTGHELSFIMFMYCLFKINALLPVDMEAAVLDIFNKYLIIVRKLQTVYKMEPAGSHGVWSLDDYQFMPFYWGSSQLIDNEKIPPSSFPESDIAHRYAKDYMFLSSIDFIIQFKKGPFSEHSNKLWNISGVQDWRKINSGLLKMYKAEVLNKFPVAQHILFGTILSIAPA